jgi:hypothetical protein
MVSGSIFAIRSRVEDAEVSADEKFVGHALAKLKLAAGKSGRGDKAAEFPSRTLEILKNSQVTLKPVLDRAP